ncbi:MAG: hypothetical protein LiPW30_48 [Parcubacteria group bacterium LiPW_30]|nr:MAG: hypothetical protein LiPW30_48 [Parcubacteria group bacterium LiPW_30]
MVTSVVGLRNFTKATVEQKRNGSCPWVVTVAFTNDEAGEMAARAFHEAIEDGQLYATDQDAWRHKHGHDKAPQTAESSLAE